MYRKDGLNSRFGENMDEGEGLKHKTLIITFLIMAICLFSLKPMGIVVSHHGWVTTEQLAMVLRATPEHGFVGFRNWFTPSEFEYFPKVSFVGHTVFNLLLRPFSSPWSQINASRVIFDLVFLSIVFLTYCLLYKLSGNWRLSLVAAILGNSGQVISHYHDMVSPEMLTLLSFLITSYGIQKTVFENKLRSGLVFFILSSLMGHVIINTFPYFVWFGWSVVRYWRLKTSMQLRQVRIASAALVLTTLFSILFLSYNVYQEAQIRKVEIKKTNIFESGKRRLDIDSDYKTVYGRALAWSYYLPKQLKRLGHSVFPYVFHNDVNKLMFAYLFWALIIFLVWKRRSIETTRRVVTILKEISQSPIFIAMLAGLFPFIVLRGYAFAHDFSALYYSLFASLFWYLVLKCFDIRRFIFFNFLALIVFCSSQYMAYKVKNENVYVTVEMLQEWSHISNSLPSSPQGVHYVGGHKNLMPRLPHVLGFIMNRHKIERDPRRAKYIVSTSPGETFGRLVTKDHSHFYLYEINF